VLSAQTSESVWPPPPLAAARLGGGVFSLYVARRSTLFDASRARAAPERRSQTEIASSPLSLPPSRKSGYIISSGRRCRRRRRRRRHVSLDEVQRNPLREGQKKFLLLELRQKLCWGSQNFPPLKFSGVSAPGKSKQTDQRADFEGRPKKERGGEVNGHPRAAAAARRRSVLQDGSALGPAAVGVGELGATL
jgi:hypothetical protein